MESVWSVSKLSTEFVGSRRELVANCVHTADADATKQFRYVGVGGVYWALRRTKLRAVFLDHPVSKCTFFQSYENRWTVERVIAMIRHGRHFYWTTV